MLGALLATAISAAEALPPPPIGVVVPTQGHHFDGWAVGPWATWRQPFSLKYGYVLFRSQSRIIVALTEPLELDGRGGEKTVKIVREFTVDVRRGEELANGGSVDGRDAVVCLVDQRRHHARLFATDGLALIQKQLVYEADAPCDFGED